MNVYPYTLQWLSSELAKALEYRTSLLKDREKDVEPGVKPSVLPSEKVAPPPVDKQTRRYPDLHLTIFDHGDCGAASFNAKTQRSSFKSAGSMKNAGKMTLQGTNTYLIGRRPPFILLDTGEGRAEYVPLLKSALADAAREESGSRALVSDIIISHDHFDHYGGLNHVLSTLRQLWDEKHSKFPYIPPTIHKFPSQLDDRFKSHMSSLKEGSYSRATTDSGLQDIQDQQIIATPDTTLEVIHTPGHTADSICLLLKEDNSLFTADTVLGAGTAVFANLSQYISSLTKLLNFKSQYTTVYPGHGPVVKDGPAKIQEYIDHRLEREQQVLKVMSSESAGLEGWTAMDIVAQIYAAYPKSLWDYAAHGITLHLLKLEDDDKVEKIGDRDGQDVWQLKKSRL